MRIVEPDLTYWQSLSDAEMNIYNRMEQFSNYFDDMTFKKSSPTHELISIKSKFQDCDEWHDDETTLPVQIELFSYSLFKVAIADLDDSYGQFEHETQTLTLDTKSVNDDSVLLHEMIHLHEYVLTDEIYTTMFTDAVFWGLYTSLREKIPSLDKIITAKLHILTAHGINSIGGNHSLLFLLKSFDIDIKMGYPLGTVYGYDLNNELQEYC